MRTKTAKWLGGLAICAAALSSREARAFCGFYVGGADTKLFNNATMVVLMREGMRTVLSMQNNYQGPPEGFAMVVPVPVVLQKENVKTLPREVFAHIDALAAPRLVEYWEQDPCAVAPAQRAKGGPGAPAPAAEAKASAAADGLGVKIEAQFSVGEYDVVVLSAEDSGGLDKWLNLNHYKIPEGAEPVLRPYVAQGMKFFVAKVDPAKVKFENGQAMLSPLRFHYDSDSFNLPIRLGLLNSNGTQDLVVHILARGKRYEVANYANTMIPTNLEVNDAARDKFGEFYAALFDETVEKHPGSVITEYSWDAQSCDPCPGPALNPGDIMTLGADALTPSTPPDFATDPTWVATVKVGATSDPKATEGLARMPWMTSQLQNCYFEELKTKRAPKSVVNVSVTQRVRLIADVKLTGMDGFSPDFNRCITQILRNVRFNPPIETVSFPVTFQVRGGEPGEKGWYTPPPPNVWGFTLTRLHARYKKDAVGQDLVFRETTGIVGGREEPGKEQSTEPKPAAVNNFQGRYVIRHRWTGPVACANPRYDVWGGPPNGAGAQPKSATNSAFATRGQTKLASFYPVPKADGPAAATPDPAPSAKSCGACATDTSSSPLVPGSLFALLALVWSARRRGKSGARP